LFGRQHLGEALWEYVQMREIKVELEASDRKITTINAGDSFSRFLLFI